MKKVTIILLLMFMFILGSNNAKAEERNVPYGVWTHIETDMFGTSIPISDKSTIIRIEIKNMSIKEGEHYSYLGLPPNLDVYIEWSYGFERENFNIKPNSTSFVQNVRTGDSKDNTLVIWPGDGIDLVSYDIRITKVKKYHIEKENDRTSGKVTSQGDCYKNKCVVEIVTKSTYGVEKVKLYRKSSKKGKYKLVKTFCDGSDLMDIRITDKGLKPNKKYWYKVRTLGWDSEVWSGYSPAKVYWTCPPKIKGKKRRGNIYTWKKIKGISGYIVDIEYVKFVGYNIFGQRLIDVYTKSYFVKSNKFKKKKKGAVVALVRGYVKHNGEYFCTDGQIFKKKKHLKNNEVSRYRE